MTTRREFLTGGGFLSAEGEEPAPDLLLAGLGNTLRLSTLAMATEFEAILNPGAGSLLQGAWDALDLVNQLEDQMSIYRPHSELSRLNARAADEPVPVEPRLFNLLRRSVELSLATEGAFDPTAGALVALWRNCRRERRLPHDEELDLARSQIGCQHVRFLDSVDDLGPPTIGFDRPGISLNLNAMGKGYALDRAAEILAPLGGDWLLHGGHSSILARGSHTGCTGWPVSIRHPLFPNRQLATLTLLNRAMSTSGSAVQFFRYQGKRYGHIVDPRTGWPTDGMLAVTVLTPDAALAEALSTAFFVLGVEKAREYCHNHSEVAALLMPAPTDGNRLEPVVCGIPETELIFHPDP
ncbi:MAG: FAD:protein FMN transferase [Planctomycetes bacterium]|nr:FAD:protein FMN transferase [Planctomycetota bacterium]